MKTKIILLFLSLTIIFSLNAEYKILLNWDEFEGECNGFLSGSIGKKTGFVNGVSAETSLDGLIKSSGEGHSTEAMQVFTINSNEGYFSFWIKDKFADQDLNADQNLIAKAQPTITVYKNNSIISNIKIPAGSGLTCKVFTLDAEEGEVDKEIKFYPKSRLIVGKIIDAVSGNPLENVYCSIQTSITKQETNNAITSSDGIILFDVEIGEYLISFNKAGYISTTYKIRMGIDETPQEIVAALSPEIREYRIVLTWGSRPKDLDAHLSGPTPEGNKFHIWYRNRVLVGGKDFLDRDDMNGYGPETITIYKPAEGEYFFSVFNYSNKRSKRSKKLSRSSASVKVYGENKLLGSFEVPENLRGNCWHVFKITEQHEIKEINIIDFVKDEKKIK